MQGSGKQYAMEADAALAVLQEQFPLYNQDSLTDVLKVLLFINWSCWLYDSSSKSVHPAQCRLQASMESQFQTDILCMLPAYFVPMYHLAAGP